MGARENVWIDYTNYRNERGYRLIFPLAIKFANNEWHPDTQWLVEALDLDKSAVRTFAMKSIHDWFSISEINTAEGLLREKVSPSYLQRSMKIGYERAIKLVTMFEKRGLITSPSDSGVRAFVGHG